MLILLITLLAGKESKFCRVRGKKIVFIKKKKKYGEKSREIIYEVEIINPNKNKKANAQTRKCAAAALIVTIIKIALLNKNTNP